jgi:hypothetical protein
MAKRSRDDFDPPLSSDPCDVGSSDASRSSIPAPLIAVTSDLENSTKIVHLDIPGDRGLSLDVISCSLPPHRETLSFPSYEEYEIHYNKVHANRCLECRKNFPTEHFLGLHIEESHDALVHVRRERGEKTVSQTSLLWHRQLIF